jgi:hypothetical protein
MRIIFLDIDGVLNSWASCYKITTEKLQLLNSLIEQTGAKIVISSSWRIGSKDVKDFIEKNFKKSNFRLDNFKDVTNRECIENIFYNDNIIGLTDTFGPSRGDEIKRWLDIYCDDVESYVIFDDETNMLDEQLEHLVQTDTYYGITDREIHLATLILTNQFVPNKIRLNCELYYRYRKQLDCEKLDSE